MKRITTILAVLFLSLLVLFVSLLLVSGAAAKKPPDPDEAPVFELIYTKPPTYTVEALGPDADPNTPSTWKHVKIRDFLAEGIVTFAESVEITNGSFKYLENINYNPGQLASTQQGDLTLCPGHMGECGEANEHINVRFVGRGTVTIPDDFPAHPPSIEVIDQPWNIKGGTGDFSHVHGNGSRSTATCDGYPCVKYYGDIRLKD